MIGRIYRIVHLESDICYIGSTFNELRKRWQAHRGDFSTYIHGKRGSVSIYPFMKRYGIDKFKLILVKEFEVADKTHLKAYEQLYINKFRKSAVNQVNPFCIKSLSQKEYRERYHKDNKEQISMNQKKYRDANKSILAEKKATKLICECGGTWTKGHGFKRHEQTKKHQKHINK